tara:strand:- start:78 stop:497 length:420 start_codon:yes stop_codon:yes gene_type:complete
MSEFASEEIAAWYLAISFSVCALAPLFCRFKQKSIIKTGVSAAQITLSQRESAESIEFIQNALRSQGLKAQLFHSDGRLALFIEMNPPSWLNGNTMAVLASKAATVVRLSSTHDDITASWSNISNEMVFDMPDPGDSDE